MKLYNVDIYYYVAELSVALSHFYLGHLWLQKVITYYTLIHEMRQYEICNNLVLTNNS